MHSLYSSLKLISECMLLISCVYCITSTGCTIHDFASLRSPSNEIDFFQNYTQDINQSLFFAHRLRDAPILVKIYRTKSSSTFCALEISITCNSYLFQNFASIKDNLIEIFSHMTFDILFTSTMRTQNYRCIGIFKYRSRLNGPTSAL